MMREEGNVIWLGMGRYGEVGGGRLGEGWADAPSHRRRHQDEAPRTGASGYTRAGLNEEADVLSTGSESPVVCGFHTEQH